MRPTKKLTGTCTHCGMPVEFDAQSVGLLAQCPFCRKQTELRLAAPSQDSAIPPRAIILTVIVVAILALGIAAMLYALHQARNIADRTPQKPRPASTQ